MNRRQRNRTIASWLLALGGFIASPALAEDAANCEEDQGMVFVCGPQNAEDLVRVPGTDWIIASGMSGPDVSGHMYLLDPAGKRFEEVYPGRAPVHRWNQSAFPDCPGDLNVADFSAHGLAIRPTGNGKHQLYVTSHGERESVEIFEVDARGEQPTLAWIGCVVMPQHASINSVAPLPRGGFITTRIMGEGPEAVGSIIDGEITGYLYEWRPGGSVTALAGTEMSGPNGIEVSRDGGMVYVGSWGRGEVARFERSPDGDLTPDGVLDMGFRIDNLRWSKRGTLYAVGHRLSERQDCGDPLCMSEWMVAEVDPAAMTARTLATKKPVPGFLAATVAIDVEDGLWLGTFHGDRIVFIPQPGLSN